MKSLISIIMPGFNAGSYIQDAVNSVIHQSYSNWELLIIDDGSTDNTQDIISQFNDHRIRNFLLPDNRGVSNARNVGLKNIQGDYFTFLDADDEMPENSLLARLEIFNKNPSVSFVDGKIVTFNSKLELIKDSWTPIFMGNPFSELTKLSGTCFWGPSWLIKKQSTQNYSFDTNLTHGEDLLFYLQISQSPEHKYLYTKQEVLHHRSGHVSAMSNLDGLEEGYRKLFSIIKENPNINWSQALMFKRKSKSIMFKSFAHRFRFWSAFKVLLNDW